MRFLRYVLWNTMTIGTLPACPRVCLITTMFINFTEFFTYSEKTGFCNQWRRGYLEIYVMFFKLIWLVPQNEERLPIQMFFKKIISSISVSTYWHERQLFHKGDNPYIKRNIYLMSVVFFWHIPKRNNRIMACLYWKVMFNKKVKTVTKW